MPKTRNSRRLGGPPGSLSTDRSEATCSRASLTRESEVQDEQEDQQDADDDAQPAQVAGDVGVFDAVVGEGRAPHAFLAARSGGAATAEAGDVPSATSWRIALEVGVRRRGGLEVVAPLGWPAPLSLAAGGHSALEIAIDAWHDRDCRGSIAFGR